MPETPLRLDMTQHHRDDDAEVSVDDEDDVEAFASGDDAPLRFRFSWRKLWRFTGPGVELWAG